VTEKFRLLISKWHTVRILILLDDSDYAHAETMHKYCLLNKLSLGRCRKITGLSREIVGILLLSPSCIVLKHLPLPGELITRFSSILYFRGFARSGIMMILVQVPMHRYCSIVLRGKAQTSSSFQMYPSRSLVKIRGCFSIHNAMNIAVSNKSVKDRWLRRRSFRLRR
jgi:hypothetical protein